MNLNITERQSGNTDRTVNNICLNLKYLGWPYRAYIKTEKNGGFCEELLSENDFKTDLAFFCCYVHGANASEAVQKIATFQKEYHKCSSCVIICSIAKIYLQSKIYTIVKRRLVTRTPPTQLKILEKLHRKKSNNWPMVSFIHNGSEITTWMGHSFKTKSTKSKVTFLR